MTGKELAVKSRRPIETKTCLKCGRTKETKEFYLNKDWKEQLGTDAWCKECVKRCTTKDAMREYFWENHREWSERLWSAAKNKAEQKVSLNVAYQKSVPERRERILEMATCEVIPQLMRTEYHFVPRDEPDAPLSYQEAKERGEIVEEDPDDVKFYSKEFNGYFKQAEIDYLQTYYEGLERDFELSDVNLRDFAKKVAKASLTADRAQNDYLQGKCDSNAVNDALRQFQELSKTASFAACKRKPGENTGLSSWAEITYKLETTGHPCTRKIEWEPDDVDRTINEYRHIVAALGLDDM